MLDALIVVLPDVIIIITSIFTKKLLVHEAKPAERGDQHANAKTLIWQSCLQDLPHYSLLIP